MTQETIGKNIRKARRDLDMTQDTLAERLAVTESAVSQWESCKTVPDVMLIPALCAVLGVTADWLLGADEEKRKREIDEITSRADALGCRGHKKEAAEILREGLKEYPESDWMRWGLMFNSGDRDEIIRIGESLLETSCDEGIRKGAIQQLVFAYTEQGNTERAKELAMKLPNVWENGTTLLLHALWKEGGEEYRSEAARYRFNLVDLLFFALSEGTDKKEAAERGIRLFELMYEDGDYGFAHTRMEDSWAILAFDAAGKQDREKTLHALGEAADHALAFLDYLADPDFRHTSVFFRDERRGSFGMNQPHNDAWTLLERMNDPAFDFVRDTPEFKAIMDRLSAEAGEWKVK